MRRTVVRLVTAAGTAVALGGGGLATAGPAAAAGVYCSGSTTVQADVDVPSGTDIVVYQESGYLHIAAGNYDVPCGATTSVDRLNVSPVTNGHAFTVDLFTPYTTSSSTTGNSLVWIVLYNSPGDDLTIDASGSTTAQNIGYLDGSGSSTNFTLNDDTTRDVSTAVPPTHLTVRGGTQDDKITMRNKTTGDESTIQSFLAGNGGGDTITGGANDDDLAGGPGDDTLNGGSGGDNLSPGDGADTSYARSATGGTSAEVDTFYATGDGQPDSFVGAGHAAITYLDEYQPVHLSDNGLADDGVGAEGDNLEGMAIMSGGEGNDVLYGAGAPYLNGNGGDDLLIDGNGPGNVAGGDGVDTVDFSRNTAPITGTLSPTGNGFTNTGGETDVQAVEKLIGTPYADHLSTDCACTFTPGNGNDVVALGSGGATYTATGTGDGSDTVTATAKGVADYHTRTSALTVSLDGDADDGTPTEHDNLAPGLHVLGGTAADTIVGSSQGETLEGLGGNDTVLGRGGSDILAGGPGSDALNGGNGDDRLLGSSGADTMLGGSGDDDLRGDDSANALAFGGDTLDGGPGDDDEYGYGGNDVFTQGTSENGSDLLLGGSGTDLASYAGRTAALNLTLNGVFDDGQAGEADKLGADVENLTGGSGADTITGNTLANVLTGGKGADKLNGLAGNDTLYSLDGLKDTLDGGTGTDKAHRDSGDLATSVESFF